MSVSPVEICNRALNYLGQAAITALDEGTPRADLCNRVYSDLLNELLQDHPWNFAITRASLAASVTEPAYEWDYQYPFPATAIRILSVNEEWERANWASEGRNILTDWESPIRVRYITSDVSEADFPPKFTSALVYRIALELIGSLDASAAKRDALFKEFTVSLRSARGADARESAPAKYTDDTLIEARR